MENRSCTDILFCIIFLAFLGGLGVVSVFGYQNGSPERLFAPLDADGRFCGIDTAVKGHSYLYLAINPLEADNVADIFSTAVCVSSCPLNDTVDIDCVPTNVTKDCNKYKAPLRYNTNLVFKKACLPKL
jgi:choline transporter-like protein 2/4/5